MNTYTTTRPINLAQLTAELGGVGLSIRDDGDERTIICHDETISQAQLEAAVEAHVAIDTEGNARTVEEALALDQSRLGETRTALDAVIAKANNQITAADTKAIARELRTITNVLGRVLRRSLGDYSATD